MEIDTVKTVLSIIFFKGVSKVRDLFRRKALAQKMRAEGKTLRQIVKAAGAQGNSYRKNMETIKRWLGEDK